MSAAAQSKKRLAPDSPGGERKRASLGKGGSDVPHLERRASSAALAAAVRGASFGSSSDGASASALAPRCAGARLAAVRGEFEMSVASFAEQLRAASGEKDKGGERGGAGEGVTSKALAKWEAGLARVPARVHAVSERMHAQLLKQLEEESGGGDVVQLVQVYPRQESMVGAEFQAPVPKYGAAPKACARKDELVWSPRAAAREGVDIPDFLASVKSLLEGDPALPYDEEAALHTLALLRYRRAAALAALEYCVAWRKAHTSRLAALRASHQDGGRVAAVKATLWLSALRAAARERKVAAGDCEALQAGLLKHGKDLAVVRRTHLRERTVGQVVDLYYRAPCEYTACVAAVEEDVAPPPKEATPKVK